MDFQMANSADAELILKLYELRRETVLRQARHWVMFEFNPANKDEFVAVRQAFGTENNAWLRQVISYWEMAASFILREAMNGDMFLDTTFEGLFIYAKLHRVTEEFRDSMGQAFMPQTAALIEKSSAARHIFQSFINNFQQLKAAKTTNS